MIDVNAVQIRMTQAFIDRKAVTIQLVPWSAQDDGTGGRVRRPGTPRTPITVAMCDPTNSGYQFPLNTAEGKSNRPDFLLVAMPGTVIEEDDHFDWDGFQHVVETVLVGNAWEVRALVLRTGPSV
jgi:hypothetical protein